MPNCSGIRIVTRLSLSGFLHYNALFIADLIYLSAQWDFGRKSSGLGKQVSSKSSSRNGKWSDELELVHEWRHSSWLYESSWNIPTFSTISKSILKINFKPPMWHKPLDYHHLSSQLCGSARPASNLLIFPSRQATKRGGILSCTVINREDFSICAFNPTRTNSL